MTDTIHSGRDALARRAWDDAVLAFSAADRQQGLAPHDLLALAEASWWSGRIDDAVDALERAYAAFELAGDVESAAMVAIRLAELAVRQLNIAVANGWVARAERLLADSPPSRAYAWLAFMRSAKALHADLEPEAAIRHGREAMELGERFGDADVRALAQAFTGSALVMLGQIDEGMGLIDEASATATSGAIEARSACNVYCHTIAACRDLGDYRRAGEWTDRAERFMEQRSIHGYPGICRVHRAELKRLRGSWSEAELEARSACEELERFRLLDGVGMAHYEIGEIRLRLGDLDGAQSAFERAFENGRDPQPGMALLLLARGEHDAAATSIDRALSGETSRDGVTDALVRGRLLPAQVDIALARGDLTTARRAVDELEVIATEHDSPVWDASALAARGAVLLEEGETAGAVAALDRSWRLWRDVDLPYESARARLLLGRAREAAGDASTARLEFRAARSVFEQLGAVTDLRRVDDLLGGDDLRATPARQRVTRTFLFTDIVSSTDLIGLVGEEAWEALLRWHDQALRSVFVRHQGEEVRRTGDGFFVTFDRPGDAIECAVAIQRTLAEHRRQHGFAPWVRIGLHAAEATRDGSDFMGQGVHVAARIGGLGDREEILASASTLDTVGVIAYPASEKRPVTLKGIVDPVDVVTVDWR